MNIKYVEIDDEIEKKTISHFGSWIKEYDCLQRGTGCFMIAAMDNDEVVGCAAIHPGQWIPPLEEYCDAFIELIEVDEKYQRQGIGRAMITLLEEKAKEFGYRQIRAWSSDDKVAALHMWYSLDYCMCPAAMLGHSIKPGFENKQIVGYYYAKMLNPKKEKEMELDNKMEVFNKSIFMKLGIDITGSYDGYQTMEIYKKFLGKSSMTWFSTNALSTGMSKMMQNEFINAINNGKKVYIYFVVGKSGGGSNEIEYSAEVLDVKSKNGGQESPDKEITPQEWRDITSTIWIKICDLQRNDTLHVDDFEFCDKGNPLKSVLNTNCHFGYIRKLDSNK